MVPSTSDCSPGSGREPGLVHTFGHHLDHRRQEPSYLQEVTQRHPRPLSHADRPESPRRPLLLPVLLLPEEDAIVRGAIPRPRNRDGRQCQEVLVAQGQEVRDASPSLRNAQDPASIIGGSAVVGT